MRIKFQEHGYRELIRKLRTLDSRMYRSIARRTMNAGAKVFLRDLKAQAPHASGAARKAMGTKIKQYRNRTVIAVIGERVGPRGKKSPKAKHGAAHLHLLEYGTADRFKTGEKAARGFVRALEGKHNFTRGQANQVLSNLGSFGRAEAFGFDRRGRIRFSRNLRAAQKKDRKGQWLFGRNRKILKDYKSGKPTGRVTARPFWRRIFQGSVRRAVDAQITTLRTLLAEYFRGAA